MSSKGRRRRGGASMRAAQGLVVLAAAFFAGSPALAGGDPVEGAKVAERCQACHGTDGDGPSPTFPRLAGQYADYLLKTLEDYRSGERDNAVMKAFAMQLSDEEMEDVSAFYASQTGQLFTIELTR